MTPQALFLYLSQQCHFSEDVAQEVVIEYLAGKMQGAEDLKLWARKRARWRRLDQARKDVGQQQIKRVYVPLDPALVSAFPTPLVWAETRQALRRALGVSES